MRGKYTCERGEFKCRYCDTVYPYSDLRDICEGRAWFLDKPDQNIILDHFGAEIGEAVIRTQYHGDDYARPPFKAGLVLSYEWTTVRDKRIVPPRNSHLGMWQGIHYRHYAEYKIEPEPKGLELQLGGDRWDDNTAGSMLAMAIGPYHFWSRHLVEEILRETWPDYVISMCRGEKTEELLETLRKESYAYV